MNRHPPRREFTARHALVELGVTAKDVHWGLFDTCASACFTFVTGLDIPGTSLDVDSGPVNTAAGPASPLSTSLQHDNHPILVDGKLVIVVLQRGGGLGRVVHDEAPQAVDQRPRAPRLNHLKVAAR